MQYLNEQFIGEEVACDDFGSGTIVEVTKNKVVIAFDYGLVELDHSDLEVIDEEVEQIDEMEKDLYQGQRRDPRKGPQGPDKTGKAIATSKMDRDTLAGLEAEMKATRQTSKSLADIRSKYGMKKEETELDEARGRPPKAPKEGQKPSAAWQRHLERQNKGEDKEEIDALGAQLRKAVSINKPVTFLNGEKKEVDPRHIAKFEDHMEARPKTIDKQKFQNDAHASHDAFVKAVTAPLPKPQGGTSAIVNYR